MRSIDVKHTSTHRFNLPSRDSKPVSANMQLADVRRWLKQLSEAELGAQVAPFIKQLIQLNSQVIPSMQRLKMMETLRPTAWMLLDHLKQGLVALAFPLSGRVARSLQLCQELTRQMSIGYKVAVQQALAGTENLVSGVLVLAVHHALAFNLEQALLCARAYQSFPHDLWRECHPLYLLAEHPGLHLKPLKGGTDITGVSTIQNLYLRLCLLALIHPFSLRQGEIERLMNLLVEVSAGIGLGDIKPDPPANAVSPAHVMALDGIHPPARWTSLQSHSSTSRYVHLEPLIRHLNIALQGRAGALSASDVELTHRLLRRLLVVRRRRSERSVQHATVFVIAGLTHIQQLLREQSLRAETPTHLAMDPPDLSDVLGLTPPGAETITKLYHARSELQVYNHIAASAPRGTQPRSNAASDVQVQYQSWHLVDQSVSGLRLASATTDVKGQVGEIVAVHLPNTRYRWQIAVVRWIQAQDQGHLESGLELLAPGVHLAQAQRWAECVDILILPVNSKRHQPPSLIGPRGCFAVGDQLSVTLVGRSAIIELERHIETTGRYSHFSYRPVVSREVRSTQ